MKRFRVSRWIDWQDGKGSVHVEAEISAENERDAVKRLLGIAAQDSKIIHEYPVQGTTHEYMIQNGFALLVEMIG